ncbi:MAG: hypothetical protein K8F59_14825 [Rhodobacteraceae bacterium]|nr:hypothetical protein [Paracoccaceae bacterium]
MRFSHFLAALALTTFAAGAALADRGYMFNFIGPSGAGKSTLIMVLINDLGKPRRISLNSGQDGAVFGHLEDRKLFVVDEKNREVIDVGAMMGAYRGSGMAGAAGSASGSMAALDAVQEQMREKLEEMLAQMPEDQRPMARKMLEKQFGLKPKKAEPAPTAGNGAGMEVTETGQVKIENGMEQHLIVISVDGRPVSEVWVTDPDNVEGGQVMIDAMAGLGGLFDEVVGDAMPGGKGKGKGPGMNTFEFARQMARLNRFPISTTDLEDDETFTLESAAERDLDPDAFEPPKGYRLRTMPGG